MENTDNLIDEYNNDVDVEMALLSLCMRRNTAILDVVQNKIVAEDFTDTRNRIIFSVIMDMFFQNVHIDRFTVLSELESRGLADKAGGQRYTYRIGDLTAVQSAINSYIDEIKERSNRVRIFKTIENIRKYAIGGDKRSSEIVDYAIVEMSQLKGEEEVKGLKTISDVLKTTLTNITAELKDSDSSGKVKLGYPKLDSMLGGLRPGSLNVLAARPGMGKSALAMNMAVNVAANQKTVVIFSLEMSDDDIGRRLLSSSMTKPVSEIISARSITDDDRRQLDQALIKLGNYPIYVDDTATINPVTMKSKIQQLISAGNPPKLVIVDYLQLVTSQGFKARNEEVSDISRNLKLLAKEFQVPIIALSQLNRKAEERTTPQISDLAESDGIARDADTVMFVDRPDYHPDRANNTPSGPENDDQPIPASLEGGIIAEPAFIYLSKNRHGKTGKDSVWWIPSKTLFYEASAKDPIEPGSPYTRTVSGDAASQNYDFAEKDEPEAPLSEDEQMQQAQEAFMADEPEPDTPDIHDDYPAGFV